MNEELRCHKCYSKIPDGKIYQDRYLFEYHCSWECLVKTMSEFFDVSEKPNITVINGVPYHEDELDENGKPIDFTL